jgi:pyruvate dehydrogenase E1 component alpha subunit
MDRETLLEWYRQMILIRRFEQRSAELYQLGKIGGFLHLYSGQEAVVVGTIAARQDGDHVITAYRDHGQILTVGTNPKYVMAELLGKETGVSKGRGGSMHLADVDRHFWGGYAIVGGHLPLAVGIALAENYRGSDNAVLFNGCGQHDRSRTRLWHERNTREWYERPRCLCSRCGCLVCYPRW